MSKGWRKVAVCTESRRPVSYVLLTCLMKVLPSVCSSLYEVSLFGAFFCLAIFRALRVVELVSPSQARVGGLLSDDISSGEWGPSYSPDVFGRGEWLPIYAIVGEVCPVKVVSDYLSARSARDSFIVHNDGSVVTRFQFAVFRTALGAAGLQPNKFRTHPFRIGAAAEAARPGFPEMEVQCIGRWKSLC